MKKVFNLSFALFWIVLSFSCSEEEVVNYYKEGGDAPMQVKDFSVTPTPGGGIITYQVPEDPNLSYLKAVYEIQPEVFREAKTSIYNDTLKLVGFGDTDEHEVKVYSVGKNNKESDPVSVRFSPLTPPVRSIAETLKLTATFGGVQINFKNESQADISLVSLVDSTGTKFSPVNTFYTAAPEGNFAARGFESEEMKFAVFVRDRWNNKSDTLHKKLTPLYEELLPKNKWKSLELPNDAPPSKPKYALTKIWDGKTGFRGYASDRTLTMPKSITIDLGDKYVLSRGKLFQFGASHLYADGAVKKWEIWGSLKPDPDGSYDSWELLGTYEAFKPSGLPDGQTTAEDKNYAVNLGIDFTFDKIDTPIRFLRFRTLEDYGGGGLVTIAELTFWGQPVD